MDIYLAATFSRQAEMRDIRSRYLLPAGHTVTSTWIDYAGQDFQPDSADKESVTLAHQHALQDANEIRRSDVFLMFTLPSGAGQGHHVEFGLAWGLSKKIHIVGPLENIFQALVPITNIFDTEEKWANNWLTRGWLKS